MKSSWEPSAAVDGSASWASGSTSAPLVAGAVAGSAGRGVAFAVASILCLPVLALIVTATRAPAPVRAPTGS